MKHFLFIFIVVCFSSSTFAQDNFSVERKRLSVPPTKYITPYIEDSSGQITRDFFRDGWLWDTKRTYQLYVPKGYDPQKSYPLVVLLHGAGRTGVSVVEKWKPLADQAGLILMGPTNPNNYWPINAEETNILIWMVQDVAKDVNIDGSRLYLFGHSSGGHFASYFPISRPYFFTAVSVHAGFNNKVGGKTAKNLPQKTPIAFFAGQYDNVIPAANVLGTAKDFAKNGHDTLFVEYVGHNHWYYTAANEINADALRFMGQYKKQ